TFLSKGNDGVLLSKKLSEKDFHFLGMLFQEYHVCFSVIEFPEAVSGNFLFTDISVCDRFQFTHIYPEHSSAQTGSGRFMTARKAGLQTIRVRIF
ncbi:hypothetical protein, partial [Methanosarcina mazei]